MDHDGQIEPTAKLRETAELRTTDLCPSSPRWPHGTVDGSRLTRQVCGLDLDRSTGSVGRSSDVFPQTVYC